MNITPISNNQTNPNFKQLRVSKQALKALGCRKADILKNDFIRKWSEIYDVCVWKKNPFDLTTSENFNFAVGKNFKKSFFSKKAQIQLFTEIREFDNINDLDRVVNESEDEFYLGCAKDKYKKEVEMIEDIAKNMISTDVSKELMPLLVRRIASIPSTKETKALHKYFLTNLEQIKPWIQTNVKMNDEYEADTDIKYLKSLNLDMSKSVAHLALENNNLELLKFLKSKGENLNDCLDLMKKGKVTDEVKEILKDVKYQDEKIFRLFMCGGSDYLRKRFLEDNPDIDINSRDENGNTLITKAVKDKNFKLLNFLTTVEGVNWNAFDREGQNILMIALKQGQIFHDEGILGFLKNLPKGKFDFNALVYSHDSYKPLSPLEYAICYDKSWLNALLDIEEIDVLELSRTYQYARNLPLIYVATDRNVDLATFSKMLQHPSFDMDKIPDKFRNLLHYTYGTKYHDAVKDIWPQSIIKKTREIYENNGTLTLEEIDMTLKAFKEINRLNMQSLSLPVNNVDDTLVHLLADIPVDINDLDAMTKMSQVLDQIREGASMGVLTQTNLAGQNMLDKAIEAENVGLVRLIVDIFPAVIRNPLYVKTEIGNEEIRNILRGQYEG